MILIPRYFSVGAAISSVIAELIITFLFIRLSKNFVSCKMIYQASVKPLLGALIMFAVVMAISQATFSKAILVVLEVASGILVYGVLMVLLKHELVMEYVRKWNQMLKKRRYH
jgi:O-antigen/teichoic acid export membrane protein